MGSTGCFVNTVEWMASLVAVQQECLSILCCTVGIKKKNREICLWCYELDIFATVFVVFSWKISAEFE